MLVFDVFDQIMFNVGWDIKINFFFFIELMDMFGQVGICIFIFVGMDKEMIEYVVKVGVDWVEFYMELYVMMYFWNFEVVIVFFIEVVKVICSLGMGLNVGYDFSLVNLKYMYMYIFWLDEVFIGYVLISDVFYMGLK